MAALSAQDIIRMLALKPHPEGGHFRETFRDPKQIADGRSVSTAIYYWYAGAPLQLEIAAAPGRVERVTLGGDISAGLRPQAVVPPQAWQAAQTLGDWTLLGCTVAPGFDFAKHEVAPQGWSPE